ncbi:24154_t:CDS:1, partial [Gigaspora margarita]
SEKLNIDKLMQIDINIDNFIIFAISNDEIHINNEEIIYGISESIKKASYRNIKDILKYMILFYTEEDRLNSSNSLIMLQISGDDRNVKH